MIAVAIGWQVFSINHSAFDLGLIGLCEFLPLLLLALPAGQLADRLPRRLVFATALALARLRDGAPPRGDDRGRKAALAVPRARGGERRRRGDREPGRRARSGPRSSPSSCSRARWRCARSRSSPAPSSGPALGGLLFALNEESVYVVAAVMLAIGVAALVAAREPDERAAGDEGAGALERARGDQVHPANAGDARCDHARPVRRPLRRRDRAAAALRRSRSSTRARSASGCCVARPRSARSLAGSHAGPPADPRQHRVDAPRRRRGVRRLDDRLRALAQLRRSRSPPSPSAASST